MAPNRIPGPLCQLARLLRIDDGTLCRQPSPAPAPIGAGDSGTGQAGPRLLDGSLQGALDQFASPAVRFVSGDPEEVQMMNRCLPNLAHTRFVNAHFQGRRSVSIDEIVLHDTGSGQPRFENTVRYLAHPRDGRDVSIHYLIGRGEGQIVAMVPEDRRANHAVGHNDRSIGIELWRVRNETRNYTQWQYETVAQLVYDILRRRRISRDQIVGHGEIEPRKPGEPHDFDWARFDDLLDAVNERVKDFEPTMAAF